jgi:predicted acetylornithine/succinylornithine family transaminase
MDRSTEDLVAAGDRHNSPSYAPRHVVMDYGKGVRLFDREGNGYLDFVAGIAVNSLGYNHPRLAAALREQSQRLLHVSNMYYTAEQVELMETLTERSFADRVFLCNSGTEATEAGMKLARRYQRVVAGAPERTQMVSMKKSFHGRTMGAITATGQPKYHKGFKPLVPDFRYVPFNEPAALEVIDEKTAGVIIEPVQGEGGVRPADASYLRALRERCDATDTLLIFDEVQTGIGRTGDLFAYQGYEVVPDIICLAKGLGGGVPVGAMMATEEVFEGWEPGSHASTFGGNPLAATAAKTVLDVIEEENLCRNVRARGEQLREGLRSLAERFPVIDDVRGRGLMVGAECGDASSEIVDHCFEHDLLINTAGGDTLRIVPPLIVSEDDVDEALERLESALEAWRDAQ